MSSGRTDRRAVLPVRRGAAVVPAARRTPTSSWRGSATSCRWDRSISSPRRPTTSASAPPRPSRSSAATVPTPDSPIPTACGPACSRTASPSPWRTSASPRPPRRRRPRSPRPRRAQRRSGTRSCSSRAPTPASARRGARWSRSAEDLATRFRPYRIPEGNTSVTRHDPDLALPILQRYFELGAVDVISVSGCLDRSGGVLALTTAARSASHRDASAWAPCSSRCPASRTPTPRSTPSASCSVRASSSWRSSSTDARASSGPST